MSRLKNWWHNKLDAEGRNTYKQIATGLGLMIGVAILMWIIFSIKASTEPKRDFSIKYPTVSASQSAPQPSATPSLSPQPSP